MSINVGIIGTGFGAKVHLPAFLNHSDFNPIIIAGRNEEKTKNIATDAGISYTTNWKDLLINKELDLIAVTTPPYLHFDMAKKVLKHKKHLLLEKPTTSNAEQARRLLVLAKERNLIAMMAHEFRWVPSRYLFALKAREGIIGDLREIHINYYMSFAASSEKPKFGWLWDSIFDGGILGAAGSHYIDMIRSTTGLEFKQVMGRTMIRTKQRQTQEGKLVNQTADDGFSFLFKLENQVQGIMNVTASTDPPPSSRFILGGTEGTLYLEGNEVFFGKAGNKFNRIEIPVDLHLDNSLTEKDQRIPPFLKLLDQLSLSLKQNKSLSPSLYDGWKNQQVLDAVRLSEKNNSAISIVDYI